jgi:CHAT domain-containing protein
VTCESGSGETLAGGELSGLATTLLLAGARSVVASLWPVDDAATAFLMTSFYRALQTGLDVPQALVSAMSTVREQPGWDDPYYWAGFVIFQRGTGD